ncbi:hypothetical protein U1Q18_048699 [Sarracenia purpurea var. burkii]
MRIPLGCLVVFLPFGLTSILVSKPRIWPRFATKPRIWPQCCCEPKLYLIWPSLLPNAVVRVLLLECWTWSLMGLMLLFGVPWSAMETIGVLLPNFAVKMVVHSKLLLGLILLVGVLWA